MIDKDQRKYIIFGLRIAGDFGAVIAIPVVILVIIGRYAEQKYGLAPFGTILGFVLAAALSATLIYKKAKAYGQEYNNLNNKEEKSRNEML